MVQFLISKSKKILQGEHKSILSAAAIIAASYLASALLGLIRNRLLAARFFSGFEADLDVYFAAFVVPDTIFQLLVVGSVSAAFIPIFQDYMAETKEAVIRFSNAAITSIGFILTLLTIVLAIFAHPVAATLAHYSPEKLNLMANLIRLMSVAQILFALSAFLTGILQAQRRFLIPAIAPLLYNIGTILGIFFLSSRLGIYSAAVGVIFGALLHMLVQLPLAIHLGFAPKLHIEPKHPGVLTMMKLMPPRTLALGFDQIERWVAVNLTSLLSAGSLSIFSFARQLYILPVSLFGVSLSQASFPSLAAEASLKDRQKFRQTLASSILQISFFALPASALVLILRIPLVRIAFGARSFPWDATLLTGRILVILALSIAPQALTHILTRGFHALKDTKTPVLTGILTMIVFVILAYVLGQPQLLGVLGISSAMAIGNTLDFILLYILLSRLTGSLNVLFKLFKMVVASVATALALWLPMRLLDKFVFDTTKTIPLVLLTLVVSAIGFLVYLIFCKILAIEELEEVRQIVKKLGNWRKILIQTDEVIEPPVDAQ